MKIVNRSKIFPDIKGMFGNAAAAAFLKNLFIFFTKI
jgi:hypothetical protein